jgi:hypothetical protein
MAPARSLPDDEGYCSSEERNLKRQKTKHTTSVPQEGVSDFEMAELCFLFSQYNLREPPPPPPPILIVTDDTDTPHLIELRLARAVHIGAAANLAEINRMAEDDRQEADDTFEPYREWLDYLYPLWQSKKSKQHLFKKPAWEHPFVNRHKYFRNDFFKHM